MKKMRSLFVFVAVLAKITLPAQASSAFAPHGKESRKEDEQKVIVLLTSLNPQPRFLSRYLFDVEPKLERIFRRKLSRAGDLKVVFQATAEDLNRELNEPLNRAVFWVSHGSFSKQDVAEENGGLEAVKRILDFQGNNILPAFQKMHPKLEFLGIVGCYSEQIFHELSKQKLLTGPGQLELFVADKKIGARTGLRRAIRSFLKSRGTTLTLEPEAGSLRPLSLRLTREISPHTTGDHLRPVLVLNRGELLGVFPKGTPGETQILNVSLKRALKTADLKLVLDTGAILLPNEIPSLEFGKLSFQASWSDADWNLFSGGDGNPIGVGSRIFKYRGRLPEL